MIIKQPGAAVQTSGKMRTAGFNMKASAKGFRIISTTLYSDPILAIVRELICNGWDAHIDARNFETNLEIHLPSELEPWFAVKDFGVGMSDDTIFGVYTTVFDSTKDQSNDAIGAMGLGSKTPFSYNDGQSFTVTSVHNGLKAVYSAYLDQGEPAITCMVEPYPTDEPNGVEVKVPVVDTDFAKFRQAALKVVPYFTAPAINCNVDIPRREFVQMDGYFIEENSNGIYAIMGNVCYPISSGKVTGYSDLTRMTNRAIYINFEIGELDIQASRESLHYDNETIEVINKRIAILKDEMLTDAQNWLDEQEFPSIREAYIGIDKQYSNYVRGLVNYNGRDFREWAIEQLEDKNITIKSRFVKLIHSHGEVKRRTNFSRISDIHSTTTDLRKYPMVIIEDDLKTGGVAIARNWTTKHGKCWYFHRDKYTTHGPMSLIERLEDHEYKILKTSDLAAEYKPAPKPRVNYGGRTPTIQVYRLTQDDWGPTRIDTDLLKTGSYHYVTLYFDFIETSDLSESKFCVNDRDGFRTLRWIMKQKGIDEIYIMRRNYVRRAANNPNSTNLLSYKFTKSYMKKAFNWEAMIVDTDLNKYRARRLSNTWNNKIVRKKFKVPVAIACERVIYDTMCKTHSFMNTMMYELEEKTIERLLKIEKSPRNELIFGLLDSCTSSTLSTKLIKLIGKS